MAFSGIVTDYNRRFLKCGVLFRMIYGGEYMLYVVYSGQFVFTVWHIPICHVLKIFVPRHNRFFLGWVLEVNLTNTIISHSVSDITGVATMWYHAVMFKICKNDVIKVKT